MGFNYREARLGFFLLLPAFFTQPTGPDPALTNTDANRNVNEDIYVFTNTRVCFSQ